MLAVGAAGASDERSAAILCMRLDGASGRGPTTDGRPKPGVVGDRDSGADASIARGAEAANRRVRR